MRPRLFLMTFVLAACASCGNEWPLSVHLDGTCEVSEVIRWPGARAEALRPLPVSPGEYGASELVFESATSELLVLVNLPEDPRWVRTESPLTSDATQFLRGLGDEVYVSFFDDGDRAIAVVDGSTMAVQCSTERVRMLDHNTAVLEGCHMSGGRRRYECNLDMMWASAEFDADGRELSGNWQPAWH